MSADCQTQLSDTVDRNFVSAYCQTLLSDTVGPVLVSAVAPHWQQSGVRWALSWSPPQRPICSRRKSYSPAAVPQSVAAGSRKFRRRRFIALFVSKSKPLAETAGGVFGPEGYLCRGLCEMPGGALQREERCPGSFHFQTRKDRHFDGGGARFGVGRDFRAGIANNNGKYEKDFETFVPGGGAGRMCQGDGWGHGWLLLQCRR